METKATLRKWGSSLGIVVPRKVINEQDLEEGEEIVVEVKKRKNPLKEAFGSIPKLGIDSQKIKDELRREWERDEKEHTI